MTIDAYNFPINCQSEFYRGEEKISGQQWAVECLSLANEINAFSEQNWLLYQDDFYQYSQYFFALLIAKKNIVLAQGQQCQRFKQAEKLADISIGINSTFGDDEKNEQTLPSFTRSTNHEVNFKANASVFSNLAIDANTSITLFTSGSTGEAKAVRKYWYQFANEIECLAALFLRSAKQHCVISTVTHKHIYGLLFKLIWPVFSNQQIVCETIEYPEQLENYCDKFSNIVLVSSPSYLSRTCRQLSQQASKSVNEIFCSGGALSPEVAADFFNHNQQAIFEIYGSTETGGIAWRQQANNSQWQLFPKHQVTIAEDSTMLLTSTFLPKGEAYKTDDRVQLNGQFFTLLGRVDRIIKLHEKRLSLDELEAEITRQAYVNASHCFLLDTPKSKGALVAVIELTSQIALPLDVADKKQLVSECKKALLSVFEPALLPRKWRFVAKLPFNSQGKLVKKSLVNLFI